MIIKIMGSKQYKDQNSMKNNATVYQKIATSLNSMDITF